MAVDGLFVLTWLVSAAASAGPASKPAAPIPPAAQADDDSSDDDEDDAVDDEAAELDKLKELQEQNMAAGELPLAPVIEWYLPENDIDAQKRASALPHGSHPEEVAALIASDPA